MPKESALSWSEMARLSTEESPDGQRLRRQTECPQLRAGAMAGTLAVRDT